MLLSSAFYSQARFKAFSITGMHCLAHGEHVPTLSIRDPPIGGSEQAAAVLIADCAFGCQLCPELPFVFLSIPPPVCCTPSLCFLSYTSVAGHSVE